MRIDIFKIFLWLAILLNTLLAFIYPTTISSVLSTVFYVVLVIRIFQEKPIALLLFSPIIFLHFSVLISLIAIESGAFMKEMGRSGYASPASSVYLIVITSFLTTASIVFTYFQQRSNVSLIKFKADDHPFLAQWAAITACGIIVAYLLLKGITTGFPLLSGTDRFAYRREFGDKLTIYFLTLKIVIAAFLGLSAANCKTLRKKVSHHAMFALYIGATILFADKFFSIITASLYYLSVQVAFNPESVKKIASNFIIPCMAVLIVACGITFYIYSNYGSLSVEQTNLRLIERFAEQGQLWFVAFNEQGKLINFDAHALIKNIENIFYIPAFNFAFENHLGVYYFIYTYSPYKLLLSFIRNAGYVTPTMGFEAYFMVMFGFIGVLVLSCLAGALVGLIVNSIMKAVSSVNPFNVLLPTFIFVQIYYLIVTGTLYSLLGIGLIKAYLALALLQICINKYVALYKNYS
jgi:Family of unknown function (DUF6418)